MEGLVPRKLLILLFGVFAVVTAVSAPGTASAQDYSLVRLYLDSPDDLAFLLSHPHFDITRYSKRRSYVELVSTAKDVATLKEWGGRFEIVQRVLGPEYDSGFPGLSSDEYRTFSEVIAFVDSLHLVYPDVVSEKWSLGQSHEGHDIWCFRLSDNPETDEGEPSVLFDGDHHAGERATYELVLMLAERLASSYGTDPEVTYLLAHRDVYFVPVVNPDGLVYSDTSGKSWRKNRRINTDGSFGVDLNRNYPFMWGGPGGSGDPSANNYRGPSAGSEPEVQALMGLVDSHPFVTHQSYHTAGRITFYPWSYTSDPTPDVATFTHMGEMMTLLNRYEHGPVGVIHFLLSGTTIDWSYGAPGGHGKIFAFTNELSGFGDTKEEQLQFILRDNLWAAIYLIRAAGAFMVASDPVIIGGDGNGKLDPGESAGISFTLTNEGVTSSASGVTVTLESDDPYIQLGSPCRDVGTVAALGSVSFAAEPFAASVDPACPPAHLTAVRVTVEEQGGFIEYELPFIVGEPVAFLGDDFESGAGEWTTTGTWNTTSATSHSPSHSLTDSPGGNYSNDTRHSATLTDPVGATHLSFWHRYSIEEGYDLGIVQVLADGASWENLAVYTGSNTDWHEVEFSLADYAADAIRVRFVLLTDSWFTDDGWYIDDVMLTGPDQSNETPPPPLLLSPAPGAEVNYDPVLVVANSTDPDGSGALTYGFRVYGDSLCTNLVASVDGVPEGSGETSWTVPPLSDGTYRWRAYAADSIERGLLGETRSFKKSVVAVLIQRFEARRIGPAIRLTWNVFSDEALDGFNIYRGDERAGYEKLINPYGLIPAADRSYDDKTIEAGRRYYYILSAVRPDGSEVRSRAVEVTTVAYELSLSQNYPNPFNPNTTIVYSIPRSGYVDLRVYDAHGRLVVKLVNEEKAAGEHMMTWRGLDDNASVVASGIYFLRLESGGKVKTRKVVFLR